MGKNARTFGQDLMRGEHKLGSARVKHTMAKNLTWVKGERPAAGLDDTSRRPKPRATLGGTLMKSLSSHPRYYEQKTAAEAKVGRKLSNEEFERDHWKEPDSEIISGTSIFDPVLCELVYTWFCPAGGRVLDPFAGGSVRGVVAAFLGYKYIGVDLRSEQIEANRVQGRAICKADNQPDWRCGNSLTALPNGPFDLIFSCPPYFDLEVYGDDPGDLSAHKSFEDFRRDYDAIIAQCVARLRPNRFACFVVGDIRDKKGFYRNFPACTIAAFQAAGATLYNEAILVTAVGSLPIRVGRQFSAGRKLGKTHQNVLIFFKGDAAAIPKAFGAIDVSGAIEAQG